jgi:hypothetical protein
MRLFQCREAFVLVLYNGVADSPLSSYLILPHKQCPFFVDAIMPVNVNVETYNHFIPSFHHSSMLVNEIGFGSPSAK